MSYQKVYFLIIAFSSHFFDRQGLFFMRKFQKIQKNSKKLGVQQKILDTAAFHVVSYHCLMSYQKVHLLIGIQN